MAIQNSFRYQVARRLSWEDLNQTNQSPWVLVRGFANFEVFKFGR